MLTQLQDISVNTPISQLPNVINYNNKAITTEFSNIYNQDDDYLTKSLYMPVGSVTAYNGTFTNVTLEHLILKNPNALSDVVKDTLAITEHNLLADRYSSPEIANSMNVNKFGTKFHFCHDASTIILPDFYDKVKGVLTIPSQYITVYNVLEQVVAEIKQLKNKTYNNAQSANITALNNTVSLLSDNTPVTNNLVPGTQVYPKTYLTMTTIQLKRLGVSKLHINDLLAKKLYTYQNINNPNIIVDNTNYNALECDQAGTVINITLKITDSGNQKFYILLNRSLNKYLVIETNRPELSRIQLICTNAYNPEIGTIWDLYNYSLPNNNTSKIDIITE